MDDDHTPTPGATVRNTRRSGANANSPGSSSSISNWQTQKVSSWLSSATKPVPHRLKHPGRVLCNVGKTPPRLYRTHVFVRKRKDKGVRMF